MKKKGIINDATGVEFRHDCVLIKTVFRFTKEEYHKLDTSQPIEIDFPEKRDEIQDKIDLARDNWSASKRNIHLDRYFQKCSLEFSIDAIQEIYNKIKEIESKL